MREIPKPKGGIARVWAAFFYSIDGLKFALKEPAFVQELVVVVAATVVLFFLPLSLVWKAFLFFATATVLVVELLNSAVEAVVDMTSPGYHELAKAAKDIGSAAVLVSITVAIIVWLLALTTMV